jgi:chromosome segregation ATPase
MVSKLKYEPHLDKAMRFIFGKTLICRNLEIATTISKQSMLDCITIDGDQVYITFMTNITNYLYKMILHFYVCII